MNITLLAMDEKTVVHKATLPAAGHSPDVILWKGKTYVWSNNVLSPSNEFYTEGTVVQIPD